MYALTKKELYEIKGGSISIGTGLLIIAGIIFIIGVIDGYVRPLSCR
ncbi:MAG: class IIb bacteriocin, lactobin A/cerein 7B family [Mollicutes bacterium]|jgi:lactobin A/cerein 7B family class IIb bacteriocin|nr:class IIb bacteriocin, lactobin A/cerein 7B family [Mollicutes bacterium]